MCKRLYGTRKGRNVVINPVPSHLESDTSYLEPKGDLP